MHSGITIYLLGANNRATHTLAEVYKKENHKVCIISWHQHNIRYSKFVDQFILLPDVEKDFIGFQNEFINLFTKEEDLLIPVNDIAVLICLQCESMLRGRVKILGVNLPSVQQFAINKYVLLSLAKKCGIDYPVTKYITNLGEFEAYVGEIHYPVIAKPVSSKLLSENSVLSFQVKKYNNPHTLTDFIRENINTIPIMLQQCLEEGYGIGFNFIAQNGELIDYYFHQRIHEAWGGGESSYRKTVMNDTYNLLPKAKSLISLMGWNGVGMLEFRVSDNKAYLMELNGRFWGSIKLGIFAGKNFPLQLLSLGSLTPQSNINDSRELYARNFKMELLWMLKGVFSQKSFGLPVTWLWNLRKAFRSSEMIEDNLFADSKYRLVDLLEIVSIPIKKKFATYKASTRTAVLWNKINRQQYKLKRGDHIVFVCKGNICRSPFAEMYGQQQYPDFNFHSTGFINKAGRLPPAMAVAAAKKYDVDISLHRSNKIYSFDVSLVDAWFIMDKENLAALTDALPEIDKNKIFSLGGVHEIEDPFNKTATFFNDKFSEIKSQVDSIFK